MTKRATRIDDTPPPASLPRLTREQSAIITAFTGITTVANGGIGPFHEYAEKLMGRPIFTHEFANKELNEEIKQRALEDFKAICYLEPRD